jgi:hypothetical protein
MADHPWASLPAQVIGHQSHADRPSYTQQKETDEPALIIALPEDMSKFPVKWDNAAPKRSEGTERSRGKATFP